MSISNLSHDAVFFIAVDFSFQNTLFVLRDSGVSLWAEFSVSLSNHVGFIT